MTDSIQAAETQESSRFSRLFLSLLPFNSRSELLKGLAGIWQQIAGSDVAVVVSNSNGHQATFDCGVAFGDQLFVLQADGCALEMDGVELMSVIANQGNLDVDRQTAAIHELQFNEQIGRVLQIGANEVASSLTREALDWTARLVEQSDRDIRDADSEEKLQAMKLESLAEFAAGAGHEINNPVATIAGRASLLLKDEADPERRRALTAIGGQAYRIRDMIGDLMLFGRPPQPEPQQLVLDGVIQGVLTKFQDSADRQECKFDCSINGDIRIFADRTQLSIVFSELIQNSLNASIDGGTITIRATTDDSHVCFTVADHGHGLTETDREHLFDPFYSGRQAGRGLGFGLCKCWRIVTNHGGQISVSSSETVGTEFKIIWPIVEPDSNS